MMTCLMHFGCPYSIGLATSRLESWRRYPNITVRYYVIIFLKINKYPATDKNIGYVPQ